MECVMRNHCCTVIKLYGESGRQFIVKAYTAGRDTACESLRMETWQGNKIIIFPMLLISMP